MRPITKESLADSVPGTESGCFRVPLYIENIQIYFPLTMGIPVVFLRTHRLWSDQQGYLTDNFIDITVLACPVKNLKFSVVSCNVIFVQRICDSTQRLLHAIYSKYEICTDTSVLIAISFTDKAQRPCG